MAKDRESPETTIFDSFVPADWASYSKMLDAHERAAWLEGYKAARLMYSSQVIPNRLDNQTSCFHIYESDSPYCSLCGDTREPEPIMWNSDVMEK